MAVIRKKIENLKVGKEYIATVRAKNTDLNVYSDFTDSIRFVVPSDSTIPEVLQNFRLFASYKNVMFVFDNSNERDVVAYEYELYHQDDITGPEPFEINSGADPVISGVGYSNVISVPLTEDYIQGYSSINTTVDGDGNEVVIYYYGRVRAIDSSNNIGDWTPIQQSEDTKLIDEEFIVNLTASKITAGTIKASEIILAQAGASTTITTPANVSVLRSANYNGTYDSGTSTWTPGTQGWIVAGTGYAEFDSAVIRGGLKAGSVFINTDNRWNADTSGNPYASGNFNEGYFKAGSSTKYVEWNPATNTLNIAGNLQGATGTFVGSVTIGTGNAIFKADSNGIYLGNATFGSAPFRVDMNGALVATNATISGNITANALVAGASISSPIIDGGTITIGTGNAVFKADSNGIYLGNSTFSTAPFRVDMNGSVTASGNITANAISANASISSPTITGGTITNGYITIEDGSITLNAENQTTNTAEIAFNPPSNLYYGIISSSGSLKFDVGTGNFITGYYGGGLKFGISSAFGVNAVNEISGVIRTGNGDNTTPSYSFINETNTGIRKGAAGEIVLVGSGSQIARFSSTATRVSLPVAVNLPVYSNTSGDLSRASSRRELKNSIENLNNSLDLVKKLNPVKFYWNSDFTEQELLEIDTNPKPMRWKNYGLIAEEVAEADENLAVWGPPLEKAKNDQEKEEMLNNIDCWVPEFWNDQAMTAITVGAIKQLAEKIEALEKIIQGDVSE